MCSTIEIDSVHKCFGDRNLLSDVSLKCSIGDIIGVFGRNGTGKSTFFKIFFGTEKCDNKFVRHNGIVYRRPYLKKNLLQYLPQRSFIPKHLTIDKVAKLCLNKSAIAEFLSDPFFAPLMKTAVDSMSFGERRFLEIKLMIFLSSEFLLLDEPFNGLTPVMVEVIKRMIMEASITKGIIITDHDYESVLDVSNKLFLICDGALKSIKGKSDLVTFGYLT